MARYSKEFKSEALKLSDEIGVKKAASQLGLPYYTLADWRNARKHTEPEPELSDTELKLQMFCGIALIYITNPVEQKVTVNDSTIRTTKKRAEHGFGLYSLNKIAKKYSGEINIVSEDEQFTVNA